MEIIRDKVTGCIKLSQEKYIDILKKFKISDCNNVTTPMEVNLKLEKGDKDNSN